jgi:hypothetical protein
MQIDALQTEVLVYGTYGIRISEARKTLAAKFDEGDSYKTSNWEIRDLSLRDTVLLASRLHFWKLDEVCNFTAICEPIV